MLYVFFNIEYLYRNIGITMSVREYVCPYML